MIRLLLVDTQSLILNGIQTILSQESDFQIVGTATHSKAALTQANALQPDIILIEAQMLNTNEESLFPQICKQLPNIKVLVLSSCDHDYCIAKAIRAGAKGYLLKSMPQEELPIIIRLVQRGYILLAPNLLEKVHSTFLDTNHFTEQIQLQLQELSSRQRAILHLVGTGATNGEIAGQLYIAEGTVKSYVTSLLKYFKLKNRAQLAIYANSITHNTDVDSPTFVES